MYVHTSHRPYWYPPFALCSWQRTHWNPCFSLWHLYHHYARCWFPCGMKTITCISFNHIQLFLLMSWHCAYQRWHLHLSRHCHCRPKASKFTSLILRNPRIYCLWCNLSQEKELSQPTPRWSIPPLNNWDIWLLTQTCWYAFTWLCQCHLELEGAKRLA
jgi:hypothetical protein